MGDWIEWQGGDCPVAPETRVEVRCRGGRDLTSLNRADFWDWRHWPNMPSPDIIAYRVVQS